jgi:hypothetical protein
MIVSVNWYSAVRVRREDKGLISIQNRIRIHYEQYKISSRRRDSFSLYSYRCKFRCNRKQTKKSTVQPYKKMTLLVIS